MIWQALKPHLMAFVSTSFLVLFVLGVTIATTILILMGYRFYQDGILENVLVFNINCILLWGFFKSLYLSMLDKKDD